MYYYIIYAIVVFAGLAMTVREGSVEQYADADQHHHQWPRGFGFYSPLVGYLDEDVDQRSAHVLARFRRLFGPCMPRRWSFCGRSIGGRLENTDAVQISDRSTSAGRIAGFLAAWVLAAFTLATLHTAPMSKMLLAVNWSPVPMSIRPRLSTSPDACLAAIRQSRCPNQSALG